LSDASEIMTSSAAVELSAAQSEEQSVRTLAEAVWVSFADLVSPWTKQVATMLVVALIGGVVAGAWVSSPTVDQEILVAAYGADVDYWMSELDPARLQANGGET